MTSKRHQTTPEIRAKIKDLRAAGWTCKAVAENLGVSETTVKNYTGFYRPHTLTRKPIYDPPDPPPVVKEKPSREALVEMVRRYKERRYSMMQVSTIERLPYRDVVDLWQS